MIILCNSAWQLNDFWLISWLWLQRPLSLGADITFHSVSKYINGHTDVIMGAVMTNSDEIMERLRFLQNGELARL